MEATLKTLAQSGEGLLSELRSRDPDMASLGETVEEFTRAVRSLLSRWRRLPYPSPFKALTLHEARGWIDEALMAADDNERLSREQLAVDQELSGLIRSEAALEVASRIRGAKKKDETEREFAERAGASVGTLSPLQHARGFLPSAEMISRIKERLGVDVGDLVGNARAQTEKWSRQARARKPNHPREQTPASIVASDASLAELVVAMADLPDDVRRTVVRAMNDLVKASRGVHVR